MRVTAQFLQLRCEVDDSPGPPSIIPLSSQPSPDSLFPDEIPTFNRQQDFTCIDGYESLPSLLQPSAPVDQSADQNESERPANNL
jgi:hypothetical protein